MGASRRWEGARTTGASVVVLVALVATCLALTSAPASAAPVESVTRVAAGIDRPGGIVRGPDGNLWFTNRGNDTIGRSTPTGTVTLFSGPGIDEPTHITVGSDGALWFTNVGNGSVGRITTAGEVAAVTILDAQLEGIATGSDGNVWVTDSNLDRVVRVTPAGTATAFASVASGPRAIAAGPDGNLWFTSKDDSAIVEMTTDGDVLEAYTGAAIRQPGAISAGPDGNLWYANDELSGFGRITPTGTSTAFACACMNPASAITAGTDGLLWFAAGPNIGRLDTSGAVSFITAAPGSPVPSTVGGIGVGAGGALWFTDASSIGSVTTEDVFTRFPGSGLAEPRSIVGGPDGNLWFTNQGSDTISRMTSAGGIASFTSADVVNPEGITRGPDGNLWFTNAGGATIGRITPAGEITSFPLPASTSGREITPGPDGNLWFTASGATSAIGRITVAGVVTMFTNPGIVSPLDITAGPDGNLWFTNPFVHSIGRITPTGVVTTFTEPGEIGAPSGITWGPDGALWFINGLGDIGRISTAGDVETFAGPPDVLLDEEIVAGPDGALWYTRSGSGAIGRMTIDGTASTTTDPSIAGGPTGIASRPDGTLWFTTDASTVGKVTLTRTTPDAPRSVVATAGFGQATITWARPVYTGGTPIIAYQVTAEPGGQQCNVDVNDTTCTLTGLTNGTTYTFSVRALNSTGFGASASSLPVTPFGGATYHPVTPTRILDSRGPNGGWDGKVEAGEPRSLEVGGRAGVPLTASAAVVNVTVTDSDQDSFLTVYPTGTTKPTASNLNFRAGQIVPNLVTVKLGTGAMVDIATSNGSTHVVADVVGYYDDGSGGGGRFNAITPTRLLDSRTANGGWPGKLVAGAPRDLAVRSPQNPAGVPSSATAVVANVTVTGADAQSFLSAWPSGVAPPKVSNLNFLPGQTVPNLVTLGIGSNGAIRFANTVGSVHVIVDVVGYYDPTVGARFHPMAPHRILDSRIGTGLHGRWQPQQERILGIAGFPGTNVPGGATGVVANVTVTDGTAESLLSLYPGDVNRPTSSNLNFGAGQIVPNLVAVGLSPQGTVGIYNDQGTVNVVADVVGFFVP